MQTLFMITLPVSLLKIRVKKNEREVDRENESYNREIREEGKWWRRTSYTLLNYIFTLLNISNLLEDWKRKFSTPIQLSNIFQITGIFNPFQTFCLAIDSRVKSRWFGRGCDSLVSEQKLVSREHKDKGLK